MHPPARYRLGEFDIAVVSDGFIRLDGGAVMGLTPRVLWEPIIGRENIDENYRIPLGLNCLVVRRGGDVLLVDTGMGSKVPPAVRERGYPGDYGYLLQGLEALGIAPADVTAVANTHLHADHCGWNTVRLADGELAPTFPNARYFVQAGEFEAATHPNDRTRGAYFPENFEPLQRAGKLELVTGEYQVIDGVHFLPTPGHTSDHASVVVSSGGETAIYTGDLVHHPVQFERPVWTAAFDILPLVNIETKKRLIDRAITEHSLLICVHNAFPGVGRLALQQGRRMFVNE